MAENYRDETLGLVSKALAEDGLDTHPEIIASALIKNLLGKKATVVVSLPPPMMALLRCLHETGLWGLTIEEVLERLAADRLRAMVEDKVQGPEWFPGGVNNIVDAYNDSEGRGAENR